MNLTPSPVTLPRRALTSAESPNSPTSRRKPSGSPISTTRTPGRAYRNDLKEFMTFAGIRSPTELRLITRAHVIAWRKDLDRRTLAPGSLDFLAHLASLVPQPRVNRTRFHGVFASIEDEGSSAGYWGARGGKPLAWPSCRHVARRRHDGKQHQGQSAGALRVGRLQRWGRSCAMLACTRAALPG